MLLSDRQQSKKLLIFAIPMIASMISQTIISFTDFYMVSQMGTDAQAAITPAGILLFVFIAFSNGLFTACNTLTSQALGRKDTAHCASYAWQSLYLAFVFTLIISPLYFVAPWYFRWLGHDSVVQEFEIQYIQICLLGLYPMVASKALTSFANGLHKPKIGFIAMFVANVFNVIGNYALITGEWGFPELGIAGAAYATIAAGTLEFVILFLWLVSPSINRMYNTHTTYRLSSLRIREILKLGSPTGFQGCIEIFGFMVFCHYLVGQFDKYQLAAANTCFKLLEVAFMPAIGLSVALTAVVGKAIGEGDIPLAKQNTRCAIRMALIYMGLVACFYLSFRHEMGSWFNSSDTEVNGWVAKMLIFCAVFQVFDALGIIYNGALRGAGDTLVPAMIQSCLAVTLMIGCGFWITWMFPEWESNGPWLAITLYIVLLGLLLGDRWRRGQWEKIHHPYPEID